MDAAPADPALLSHLDLVGWDLVRGWACDPVRPGEPVPIRVEHEGETVVELLADEFRADLLAAGYGAGRHGFRLTLPKSLFATSRVVLRVRHAGTGAEVAGSPFVLDNDEAVLGEPALAAFGASVALAASGARDAGELDALARFLLGQFDLVQRRRAALARDEAGHRAGLDELVAGAGLSDVLRGAARAVLDRYPPLDLPEQAAPDVSVVVPAKDLFATTYRCIESLLERPQRAGFEVILVDDGSTDETVFAGLALRGGVRVLRREGAGGFVAAVNAGAAAARGRLLLLLNNDTEAGPGWLDELVDTFARDPAVGIAGAALVYPDGRLQEAGCLLFRMGEGWNWGRGGDPDRPEFRAMRDADYVSGAALMIPRALFEAVGGLSPEYAPAYYEDADLCMKVRAAGRRVVVQPAARIVHHEGASAGTDRLGGGPKRYERINQRRFLHRWAAALRRFGLLGVAEPDAEAERDVRLRALFIDETTPTPDRDAGSCAAAGHMRALQRIGYRVHFVPAGSMAREPGATEALERVGIVCHAAPWDRSVEELLRRRGAGFDLVYVHRVANATRYAALVREHAPGARLVFAVADLHHLRTSRQAELEDDDALRREAARLREAELAAVRAADRVIVHSSHEAALLREAAPGASVHVIPWAVPTRAPRPFAERRGVAFIGGYRHLPNVDAAVWLAREVMPLVWAADPAIELLLAGGDMPASFQALQRPGLRLLGHVPDLDDVLGRVRLTAAPLRYGAGLKGKLLSSLAAGVPCVPSAIAAEGAELPEALLALACATPAEFAAAILALHADEARNTALGRVGIDWIGATCSEARVDALLEAAVRGEA